MIRLQNVLKMFLRRICETSWRCLENVLKTLWQDVMKTSWRRMDKNILILTNTSWRCLEDVFWRRMINKNIFVFINTSWRRLEDVFWRRRRKISSRRLQDAFIKTNIYWVVCPPFLVTFEILIDKCTTIHYFEDNPVFDRELSFPSPLILKIIEKKVSNFELQF